MSTYAELSLDQGTTFSATISITSDQTNANINLVGFSVQSQLRYSYYAANATETFTCTIPDPTNGQVTLGLASANTANIDPGRYYFDVMSISPSSSVQKVFEGVVNVFPSVTRIT